MVRMPEREDSQNTRQEKARAREVPPARPGWMSANALFARVLLLASSMSVSSASTTSVPYPSLPLVESALLTTAKFDFNGHQAAFDAAAHWSGERLRASSDRRGSHLVCAEYTLGREVAFRLQELFSPTAVRPACYSSTHGACFFVTASHSQVEAMSAADPALVSAGPFPSALKIAPGLLDHGDSTEPGAGDGLGRLSTTYGVSMRIQDVDGLNVELSPGTLPAHAAEAGTFISDLLEDLMSESMDLHASNVWSDPSMLDGEHRATPEGALRGREWSRAAAVVHDLSAAAETTPGDICSWDSIAVHHGANDVLLVSGLCQLLCVAAYWYVRAFVPLHWLRGSPTGYGRATVWRLLLN